MQDNNTGGVTYNTHTHTCLTHATSCWTRLWEFFSSATLSIHDGRKIYMLAACAKAFLNDYFFDFSLISRSIHRTMTSNRHYRCVILFCKIFMSHSASLEIVLTCARLEFLRSGFMDLYFQLKFRNLKNFP